MNKIIGLLVFTIFLLVSCTGSRQDNGGRCRIYGQVVNDMCDGATIFLVPISEPATNETVDSAVIKNKQFYFESHHEKLAVLRLQMPHRIKFQELLVVTEPGDIKVHLDSIGSVTGTPQNDSLQQWKEHMEVYIKRLGVEKDSKKRTEISNQHKAYTIEMGHNIGKQTSLGKFLLGLYPETSK